VEITPQGSNEGINHGIYRLSLDKLSLHRRSMVSMRFRNLYAFNLIMLAKQAWKIIVNPHSLVTQVLKTKYFPHNVF